MHWAFNSPLCSCQAYELMMRRSAPLLIYYIKCQDPARGLLKLPLNRDTLLHTKYHPRGCKHCLCECPSVLRGGVSQGGQLLWANRTAANWINTLTSSEQWRSERKEGRGKKCSLLGRLVSFAAGRMKARWLKMYKDYFIDLLCLTMISELTR